MNGDTTMLELFLSEARDHSRSLEQGLLKMEESGQAGVEIEPLMRAAHSIKGAARIVGLDRAVELAHAMEDVFVAVGSGKCALSSAGVDVLLSGTDFFSQLAKAPVEEIASWIDSNTDWATKIQDDLGSVLAGEAPALEAKVDPAPEPKQPATCPEPVRTQESDADRAVRVSADKLSRLMGLAGEAMIEARNLEPFLQGLHALRENQENLGALLEDMALILAQSALCPSGAPEVMEAVQEKFAACRDSLGKQIEALDAYSLETENLTTRLYHASITTRMRPIKDGLAGFSRMVRDLAKATGKKIRLEINGENTRVDRDILSRLEAPLNHILRNAIDHGIEPVDERQARAKPPEGLIKLVAGQKAGMLLITVKDDGQGLDPEKIRARIVQKGLADSNMAKGLEDEELFEFLFLPGFSTSETVTEISGRGVGLDVVQAMVREVGGSVRVESVPGSGTRFLLELPLTLSVVRMLMVGIAGEIYAFPLNKVDQVLSVPRPSVLTREGRQYFLQNNEDLGLVPAGRALGLVAREDPPVADFLPVVVIRDRLSRYGLVVDRLLGEKPLVVRPLNPRLGLVPNVSAAAISDDGSPVLVLDADDLARTVDHMFFGGRAFKPERSGRKKTAKRVLVVDDSITVREAEKRILENKGYLVDTAVDGMDGLHSIKSVSYDLVVTDVDMPRLNGIDMVKQIRKDRADLPVVMVSYKDRDQDREDGLMAGANFYLTKSSFYDESFLDAVRDLIGDP